MKNKVLLLCAGLLLLIFLVFGTYSWYIFFHNASGSYGSSTTNPKKDGEIVLNDSGNKVYDADAKNLKEEDVDSVVPYIFSIKNSGEKDDYTLYIEDVPVNTINDGCTSSTLLSRSQLRYQLKMNGKVVKDDYLSNVEDNILDTRTIDKDTTNEYELRIYIHENAKDWENKHYHYKVVINNKG